MNSLINIKFNWVAFVLFSFVIRVLFLDISWVSFIASLIVLHQLMLLFSSINHVIPIRYLLGSYMAIQMLLGPILAYNGLDKYQYFMYQMKISEIDYFAYVLPAVIVFILGLHLNAGKLRGELIDEKRINLYINKKPNLPLFLVGVGFVSSILSDLFSADLAFMFYLLGGMKFIGVFMLFLSRTTLKLPILIAVIITVISSSLIAGMFHDLLTWLIMLGAVIAIKYKPSINVKLGAAFSFLIIAIVIQQVKGDYRAATAKGEEAGIATFEKVYREGEGNKKIYSFKSLASSTVRINQGFIITNIMSTVPSKVPFSEGEELELLIEAALLPRILAPDKLKAGDRNLFMKYTGMKVQKGTSMGLSSVGDAYINFGIVGGCIFMFILGLLYSEVLNAFYKFSKNFPVLLLFTPLVFYYPIRPDCELQTILGHLVKSCFLIFVIFLVWKKEFRMSYRPFWKKYSS